MPSLLAQVWPYQSYYGAQFFETHKNESNIFTDSNLLILLWYHGLMARRCFPVAKIGSSSLPGIVRVDGLHLFLAPI